MSIVVVPVDNATLILNGHSFLDMAAGDVISIVPTNDLTSHTPSAAGGTTIQKRTDSDMRDVIVRVQKYGDDDVHLNDAMNEAIPVLFNGSLKSTFYKDNRQQLENWSLRNGSITKQAETTQNNQEGNAIMEYTITFRSAKRLV